MNLTEKFDKATARMDELKAKAEKEVFSFSID